MKSPLDRPIFRYGGVAFITCSMLLLQLFLTRVFTVLFHSSFAFLAISIAFLGLGSAGVFAYLFPWLFPPAHASRRLPVVALVYSVVLGVAFWVLVTLDSAIVAHHTGAAGPLKL